MKEPPHPPLAQGKVRYVGDASPSSWPRRYEQAEAAAEMVADDYEVLPAVVGVVEALQPGAPQLYGEVPANLCCDWDLGDAPAVDAAFAQAAHVTSIELVNQRLVGNTDGTAGGDRRIRFRQGPVHALDHEPVPPQSFAC